MRTLTRIAFAAAIVLSVAADARGTGLWLHIRVNETGERPTSVKVNVPFGLVERIAPLVRDEKVDRGTIAWNGDSVDVAELRGIWNRLRASGGTVVRDGASWSIVRKGAGELLVVKETGGEASGAEARIPAPVVEALLSSPDRLDFEAAVREVAKQGAGDLVAVDDDGTKVRIWVDAIPEAE